MHMTSDRPTVLADGTAAKGGCAAYPPYGTLPAWKSNAAPPVTGNHAAFFPLPGS